MSELSLYLLNMRKDRGMSLEQVAVRAGVSKQTISYWELGRNIPRDRALDRLAAGLGLDYDLLLAMKRGDRESAAAGNSA